MHVNYNKRLAFVTKFIITGIGIVSLWVLFGWQVPVIWQIESLHLPVGSETVYRTKVCLSDVHWIHIKGEKVIKCDLGYEAAKEYIETHNSASKLMRIDIAYIKISYFKQLGD